MQNICTIAMTLGNHLLSTSSFYAIHLAYIQKNSKQNNLKKLLISIKTYSNEFIKVFPQDTPEKKRLFELIKTPYINGRYCPDFRVTKEDIDALDPKVELLRDITKRICEQMIKGYVEK